MASLFSRHNINRCVLLGVLGSFTLTHTIPVYAAPQGNIGLNEVAFLYRVEQLVEKIKKLEHTDNKDKMYSALIDLKNEIETYKGIKFDLGKYIDNVEKDLKKQGITPSKKEFEHIRKTIKKKEKKQKNHHKYLKYVLQTDSDEISVLDEEVMFPEHLTGEYKHDKEDDEEEVYVPARLVFGITLALCGVFLSVLPIPVCKQMGTQMVTAGFLICGECLSNKVDEDHKENKAKQKK